MDEFVTEYMMMC